MQLREVARDSPRPGPWGPTGKRLKQFGLCHLGKMQRGLSPVRKNGENSTLDKWRQSDQKKKKRTAEEAEQGAAGLEEQSRLGRRGEG